MKRWILLTTATFVLLALFAGGVAAQPYHTTLLTVGDETWEGGTADLYLEMRPGEGRIFIDSYPLSKLDTQFSTRYANEVACEFLKTDCNKYDFFYTIRAESSVVGGPSAGAAIAVLTIAALDHQPIRQDVAMTGTINSGGLIGPVAGIIPKVEGAKAAGITTVVVPSLAPLALEELRAKNESFRTRNPDNGSATMNVTINFSKAYDEGVLEELSDADGEFRVVQASDLYEALPYFMQKRYEPPQTELVVDESYERIMSRVAHTLCGRRGELLDEVGAIVRGNESLNNKSLEIDRKIAAAFENKAYYSAASYCFGHNIDLRAISLLDEENTEIEGRVRELNRAAHALDQNLQEKELTTIGDIETYAIVKERIIETQQVLKELDDHNISLPNLAYATERLYSAKIWSAFFDMKSKPYLIDNEHLAEACQRKLGEAEERVTYVETYLPPQLTIEGRKELQLAYRDVNNEEYALCIFKASKAKAEANILSSVLAISEQRVDQLVAQKLAAAKRVLAREQELGLFPIMGYSYFEYANTLDDDSFSALTFAEYTLELSNLHLYFPEREPFFASIFSAFRLDITIAFVVGFFTGALVLGVILFRRKE